jgi:Spy/CpxP family protein refolding chaperone
MKLARSIALSLSVACLSLGAVACGGTVEQPQTTASAATKAPVGTNTHGVVKLVGEALGEVPLRPDQRAELEKLAQEAEARHALLAERRKELMLAIADQVEKGAIDRAALEPTIDRLTADLEKARTEDRAAITRLHAILDKDQRNAFVDALEGQMEAKGEAFAHAHGKHGKKGFAGFAKMKQLADELKLTEEQRSQIREAMKASFKERFEHSDQMVKDGPKRHAKHFRGEGARAGRGAKHHRFGKHALEAFREDEFDIEAVAPPVRGKVMAAAGTERMTAMAEKILPILTAEQRKIAADKLRSTAQSGDSPSFVR